MGEERVEPRLAAILAVNVAAPASESLRRTNSRESGERLAVYWGFGVAAALTGDGFPKVAESRKPLTIADWPLLPHPTTWTAPGGEDAVKDRVVLRRELVFAGDPGGASPWSIRA